MDTFPWRLWFWTIMSSTALTAVLWTIITIVAVTQAIDSSFGAKLFAGYSVFTAIVVWGATVSIWYARPGMGHVR